MLPNGMEPELGLEEELGFEWEERRGAATGRVGGVNKAGGVRRDLRLGNIKGLQLYGSGRSPGGFQEAIVSQ